MNHTFVFNRRDMLGLLGGAAVTSKCASGETSQPPRTALGLVIYTQNIRRRMMKAKDPTDDLFEPSRFLQHCHALGAGGMQIPLGTLRPDVCESLRTKADDHGMFIEGIVTPPFEDTDVERFEAEIETAARVGVQAVRTVIIPGRRYERFKSLEEFNQFAERGRRSLERAKPVVDRHQVHLAVENHKDQRLDDRVTLLKELDSPYIGACVDTGNSFALLEEPLAVVEALAPYAFAVHLKDQAVQQYDDGFLLADVALGQGFLDLKAMVSILRKAKPNVNFSLETITRDPLRVPCLAESYWPTFPDVPATDLVRTLRTVRARAAAELPAISMLSADQQVEIERRTVAKSLDYARTQLGL